MKFASTIILAILGLVSGTASVCAQDGGTVDPAQAAKDARVVETLLRLKTIDLKSREDLRAGVIRYLATVSGTARFVEVSEALRIDEVSDQLVDLAIAQAQEPLGIQAGRALFRLEKQQLLFDRFAQSDETTRSALLQVMGGIGNQVTSQWLIDLVQQEGARADRQQAISSLLLSRRGQESMVQLIEAGNLPETLSIFAAGEIQRLASPDIRERISQKLSLPETADAEPLPPLSELLSRQGDVETGRVIFFSKGTCSNCHVVGTEGKEVGPALTEIGAKLSRDAMFVSILDPSAAVSHNYETFIVETIDGEILQGLKVSETPELITLKLSDGQVREIPTEYVDLFEKQELSLMPTGLQKNLTAAELVSLIDYLMTLKP